MGDVELIVQHADDGMTAIAVDFRGVGVLQPRDIPGELNQSALQTQADAEIRNFAFTGITDRLDFAGDAAIAEAAGHQDAVHAAQTLFRSFTLDIFRLDLADEHAAIQGDAGVVEGLVHRFIGAVVFDVFADDGHGHFMRGVLDALKQLSPAAVLERLGPEIEFLHDQLLQPIFHAPQGYFRDV